MNKIIISAFVAFTAFAGAASAMTSSTALASELRGYPVAVDVNSLSTAQVAQLTNLIHSGDSAAEVVSGIRSIIK